MTGLAPALGLEKFPALVAVAGSGGKTTLMFRLAREAAAQGLRVITGTSTKIFPPGPDECPITVIEPDPDLAIREVLRALDECGLAALAANHAAQGKLSGHAPETLDRLFIGRAADLMIIEADGSRGLPLKSPGPYEPVYPLQTTMVIVVVGLSGLGRPLDDSAVFRPEIFARHSGLALGETITAQAAARAVLHPQGPFAKAPPQAARVVFLNQADLLTPSETENTIQAFLDHDTTPKPRLVWGSLRSREEFGWRLRGKPF